VPVAQRRALSRENYEMRKKVVSKFKRFMALANEPHADYALISRTLCEDFKSFSEQEKSNLRRFLKTLWESKIEYERTFAQRLSHDLAEELKEKDWEVS